MTRQIVLGRHRQSYMDRHCRRQTLLLGDEHEYSSRGGSRVGEVVGGTAAECAAVCCCCPCGLAELVVLAVYKVPAGLCRKALRQKRRRRLMKKGGMMPPARKCGCCGDEELVGIQHLSGPLATAISTISSSVETDKDVEELEKEMWEKFYSAGFWRSPSQKSDFTDLSSTITTITV